MFSRSSLRLQTRFLVSLFALFLLNGFIFVSAQDIPQLPGESTPISQGDFPARAAPRWFPTSFQQAQRLSRRLWSPNAVGDPVYKVNTTEDTTDATPGDNVCADASGKCSLRAAIMEANAHAGFEHINVPAGTYTLTIAGAGEDAAATGDLDITSPDGVNITGSVKVAATIIDGGDLDRIFHILATAQVSLSNLTIRNGTSDWGGGLLNNGGSLYGQNLFITANASTNSGGGLVAASGAFTEINNSAVTVNQAATTSGGIDNINSTMLLTNITVSGNRAGGGYNAGGIGNTTTATNYMYITHGTIVNNAAGLRGGGIRVQSGPVYLQSSILGNNSAPEVGPNCYTSGTMAYVVSLGYNHVQNTTDCQYTKSDTDLTLAPQIGSLADNGGKTPTHALPMNSSHREAIPAGDCSALTDQRGVRRPQDANNNGVWTCDVGAFEHAGPFMLLQPLPNEALDFPTGTFVWTAQPGATQYRVEVQGVGTAFKAGPKGPPEKFCAGAVCSAAVDLSSLPNFTKLRWRVRATLPAGNVATLWQPFSLAAPGVPILTTPANFATLLPANFSGLQWTATPLATKLKVKVFDAFSDALVFSETYTANSTIPLSELCTGTACSIANAALDFPQEIGRAYRWLVQTEVKLPGGRKYKTRSEPFYFSFVPASLTSGQKALPPPIEGFRAP